MLKFHWAKQACFTKTLKFKGAKLSVYTVLGELVENLVNREMVKGSHSINFTSNELSSGIYYYRIEYDGGNYINKLILLK